MKCRWPLAHTVGELWVLWCWWNRSIDILVELLQKVDAHPSGFLLVSAWVTLTPAKYGWVSVGGLSYVSLSPEVVTRLKRWDARLAPPSTKNISAIRGKWNIKFGSPVYSLT